MDSINWKGSGVYNPTQHNASNESANPVDPASGSANVVLQGTNTDNDILNNPESSTRLNQQQVLPSAIKSRLMQPVVDDGGVILNASISVHSGNSATATLTTTSRSGGMIVSNVYWQVYIDDKTSNNRMPQVQLSKFYPFYTWNNLYDSFMNPISKQPGKNLSSIQITNNAADGFAHLIIVEAYVRSVINGAGFSTG